MINPVRLAEECMYVAEHLDPSDDNVPHSLAYVVTTIDGMLSETEREIFRQHFDVNILP